MFRHILVPTDGSRLADKAVNAAITFALESGAKLTVYHAIEDSQVYMYMDPGMIRDLEGRWRKAGRRIVDAAGKRAKLAGVPFDSVVSRAKFVHEGILEAAGKRKCDVVFIASHGRSGFARAVMGSVTQKVLAYSKIPVLVYR